MCVCVRILNSNLVPTTPDKKDRNLWAFAVRLQRGWRCSSARTTGSIDFSVTDSCLLLTSASLGVSVSFSYVWCFYKTERYYLWQNVGFLCLYISIKEAIWCLGKGFGEWAVIGLTRVNHCGGEVLPSGNMKALTKTTCLKFGTNIFSELRKEYLAGSFMFFIYN